MHLNWAKQDVFLRGCAGFLERPALDLYNPRLAAAHIAHSLGLYGEESRGGCSAFHRCAQRFSQDRRSRTTRAQRLMRLNCLKTLLAVCFLITFLIIPLFVQAAVVVLKNGDRISGRIVKMEKERIEIDPPFSDIIKIKWADVQTLRQFSNRENSPHLC